MTAPYRRQQNSVRSIGPLSANRTLFLTMAMLASAAAQAQSGVPCGPFAGAPLVAPAPRAEQRQTARFAAIKTAAAAHSYRTLFLGDSLTQRWDAEAEDRILWDQYFRPLDALNAGIDGDRTEHLLWRLEHGNLDNQAPRAIALLIGTNDLGHGRTPEAAAAGTRRILLKLRERLPRTRILLEGLWPRADVARLGAEIAPTNRLLRQCADPPWVVYADPGRRLLDTEGRLPRALAPDGLHPAPAGYRIVSPEIAAELAPLLADR
jgi:lysophospholipase L1-like esterase